VARIIAATRTNRGGSPEVYLSVTDAELVELARKGDRGACDALVERHQGAVYRAAFAALRIAEDAEEVAQDAFVRAFAALDRYRGDASFKTWVLTIAWRRALSRRRRNAWLLRHEPSVDLAVIPARTAGPEHLVMSADLSQHLRRLIGELPRKFRDVLLLEQTREYRYEEIAAMVDAPVGTVKWRISEARRRLRVELTKLGYDQQR
jgi:RNA polymerase sigma-70 factor, ECF subfamily